MTGNNASQAIINMPMTEGVHYWELFCPVDLQGLCKSWFTQLTFESVWCHNQREKSSPSGIHFRFNIWEDCRCPAQPWWTWNSVLHQPKALQKTKDQEVDFTWRKTCGKPWMVPYREVQGKRLTSCLEPIPWQTYPCKRHNELYEQTPWVIPTWYQPHEDLLYGESSRNKPASLRLEDWLRIRREWSSLESSQRHHSVHCYRLDGWRKRERKNILQHHRV